MATATPVRQKEEALAAVRLDKKKPLSAVKKPAKAPTRKDTTAQPARVFAAADGTDIKVGDRVFQKDTDLEGVAAYRVMDGKRQVPRIGIEADGLRVNGRDVKRICVDADSLLVGTRPTKRRRSR